MKYDYEIKYGFTIRFNEWLSEVWTGFDNYDNALEAMNEVLENVKEEGRNYISADVGTQMVVVRP